MILILIIWGCNSHKTIINPIRNSVDKSDLIDSLKWAYYVYNYSESASFRDTFPPYQRFKFRPVECDINFDGSRNIGKDSFYYMFSLVKPGHEFCYVEGIATGFNVYKGNIIPYMQHGVLDFTKYPDSVRYYYNLMNKDFIKYLSSYTGEIGKWLQKEKIKRNIF